MRAGIYEKEEEEEKNTNKRTPALCIGMDKVTHSPAETRFTGKRIRCAILLVRPLLLAGPVSVERSAFHFTLPNENRTRSRVGSGGGIVLVAK